LSVASQPIYLDGILNVSPVGSDLLSVLQPGFPVFLGQIERLGAEFYAGSEALANVSVQFHPKFCHKYLLITPAKRFKDGEHETPIRSTGVSDA
jgi:hypothetical protein